MDRSEFRENFCLFVRIVLLLLFFAIKMVIATSRAEANKRISITCGVEGKPLSLVFRSEG